MSSPWEDARSSFSKVPDQHRSGKEACHALLYCKTTAVLFERIPMEYAIMMQMRFDGTLGFPGGYIDSDERRHDGLNRELKEEIGLKQKEGYLFTEQDYYGTWVHNYMSRPLVDHFYVKEYPEEIFKKIERSTLEAHDWGGETMGIIRVPLSCFGITTSIAPFSQFLRHSYVGNAREQLIRASLDRGMLREEGVLHAWDLMTKLQEKRSLGS